jgi:hypothetical protein
MLEAPNSTFVCAKKIIGKTIESSNTIGMTRRPIFSTVRRRPVDVTQLW